MCVEQFFICKIPFKNSTNNTKSHTNLVRQKTAIKACCENFSALIYKQVLHHISITDVAEIIFYKYSYESNYKS